MPVGKTKDAGWQVGVSITVPRPGPEVWHWLVSREGLATWLGHGIEFSGEKGETYESEGGIRGELRSYRPLDRIRLTWHPPAWDHESTVQVAVDDKGDRTRIVFHQERLADAEERATQRDHWKSIATEVASRLTEGNQNG